MNVSDLLAGIQARQEQTAARAAALRGEIEQLTAELAEHEARIADLETTRKTIAEFAVAEPGPDPTETGTAYQDIVTAFNQHPGQVFRARELHELLGLPTDEPSVNITRTRLGRLARQGFLTQPGRGRYQKRT